MATTFDSKVGSASQGAGIATIHTVGSSTQLVTLSLIIANTYTTQIKVTVDLVKGGATAGKVCYQAPIEVGDSLTLMGGDSKVAAETGDVFKITIVTTSGTADYVFSYMEIT